MGFFGSPYTDHPDGHDCFTKMFYCSKYGAWMGGVCSIYDVILISKPKGYFPTFSRIFICTAPFVASALTFSAVACAATSIRKKDDHLNYFLAGVTAGTVFGGMTTKSYVATLPLALATGVFSMLVKNSMLNNWVFLSNELDESEWFKKPLYIKKEASEDM